MMCFVHTETGQIMHATPASGWAEPSVKKGIRFSAHLIHWSMLYALSFFFLHISLFSVIYLAFIFFRLELKGLTMLKHVEEICVWTVDFWVRSTILFHWSPPFITLAGAVSSIHSIVPFPLFPETHARIFLVPWYMHAFVQHPPQMDRDILSMTVRLPVSKSHSSDFLKNSPFLFVFFQCTLVHRKC